MIDTFSWIASRVLAILNFYRAPQSFWTKSVLLFRVIRNRKRISSATELVEQLTIISALLRLPCSVDGVIIECGCYMGGATANLSLAARVVGRKLYVFDSFRGLPEPKKGDARHLAMNVREFHSYTKASWCGPLEKVKANVASYGAYEVCTFVEGYFDSTLPKFSETVALAFCDVDLRESLQTCVSYIWPLIVPNGLLFVHEAHHLEIASLFYDPMQWSGSAPGLVGAGSGLGLLPMPDGTLGSCLGYVIKSPSIMVDSMELGNESKYKVQLGSSS